MARHRWGAEHLLHRQVVGRCGGLAGTNLSSPFHACDPAGRGPRVGLAGALCCALRRISWRRAGFGIWIRHRHGHYHHPGVPALCHRPAPRPTVARIHLHPRLSPGDDGHGIRDQLIRYLLLRSQYPIRAPPPHATRLGHRHLGNYILGDLVWCGVELGGREWSGNSTRAARTPRLRCGVESSDVDGRRPLGVQQGYHEDSACRSHWLARRDTGAGGGAAPFHARPS